MKNSKRKRRSRSKRDTSSSSEELVLTSSESSYDSAESSDAETESAKAEDEPSSPQRNIPAIAPTSATTDKDDGVLATRAKRLRRGRTREELDELRQGEPMRAALAILERLVKDPAADVFLKPVNELWSEEDLPGYFDIIQYPMDLGTVHKQTKALDYVKENDGKLDFDDAAFLSDLRLVFRNAMKYNHPKSEFYRVARNMLAVVDRNFSVRHGTPAVAGRHPISDMNNRPVVESRGDKKRNSQRVSRVINDNLIVQSALGDDVAVEESVAATISRSTTQSKIKRTLPRKPMSQELLSPKLGDTPNSGANSHATAANGAESKPEESRASPLSNAVGPKHAISSSRPSNSAPRRKKSSKSTNTSSTSSDESEANNASFAFYSMEGIKKKRGRRSAVVLNLEIKHSELMKRRKLLRDLSTDLGQKRQIELSGQEKAAICDKASKLDFTEMKYLVDILVAGMKKSDMLQAGVVDLDVEKVDNAVLREVEVFLENPTVFAALGTLKVVEDELAAVETKLVNARYRHVPA